MSKIFKYLRKNFITLLLSVSVVQCRLPSSITPRCPPKSAKLNECIGQVIENLRPRLATGDLGDGFHVPKMEPFNLKRIGIKSHDVNCTINDLMIYGGTSFEISKLRMDMEDFAFEGIAIVPTSNFSGHYDLDVKAGAVINGTGPIRGEFKGIGIKVRVKFQNETVGSKTYVRFKRFQARAKIQSGTLHLDNLFNGDPVLGDFGNQFINTKTEIIFHYLIPILEREITYIFTKILETIFKDVTFDDMFLVRKSLFNFEIEDDFGL